jgi:two-component system NtrC family response regulator
MAKVLIIDDDLMYCSLLADLAKRQGHEAAQASTLEAGLSKASQNDFDIVFLDVHLPDGNGLDILPLLRQTPSTPEVIIVTGAGDHAGAEMAIRSGAWDYISKGASLEEITLPLVRALQYRGGRTVPANTPPIKTEGIVGHSPPLRACLEILSQASASDAAVLITGESGTGKELFARAIHTNSQRHHHNFVVIDCAALPANLVESELFGHEKGAFTGADRTQEGLVLQAHQGTLFLDEVGELPLSVQGAFLRVLQERRFRSVGGQKENISDFRLVAATNRNLEAMVEKGAFRNDLLFRLRSLVIHLPPLRDCVPDIKDMALYHLESICRRSGLDTKSFSPEFLDLLTAYHWPGNVRELVNALEMSVAAARNEPALHRKHLPAHIRIHLARASLDANGSTAWSVRTPPLPTLAELRTQTERRYFQDLMDTTQGNIRDACKISGLSRSRLYELLQKYDALGPA